MNVWAQLDELVDKHEKQHRELIALQKEGGVFRKPRFRPPCVWVLIYGAKAGERRGERIVHTTYEAARAALEVEALRMREVRREREEAEAKERAAKAAAKKGRR